MAFSSLSLLCLSGCGETHDSNEISDCLCFEPPAQLVEIKLVPLGGISDDALKKLSKDLKEGLDKIQYDIDKQYAGGSNIFEIEILPNDRLPDSCYYEPRDRYRADKLLKFLKQKYGGKYDYVIGVTDRDISTSIHNAKDYGIQGLSYLPGNVTIISTFRVKNRNHLWKLAAHEFCHGYFALHHCDLKDPRCLIKDAEGGNPHFELKETLCDSCIRKIR